MRALATAGSAVQATGAPFGDGPVDGSPSRGGRGRPQAGRRGRRAWALVPVCLAWALALFPARGEAALPQPPVIAGRSAAVLDAATGAVLWSYHGHTRMPMASTTKMMTALVALGLTHDRTSGTMVVPSQVLRTYGQTLDLRPGDRYTFQQLLEGMLLFSANDAAMAIAVDTAGSERAFVHLMNRRARALGLTDTHFANPDGLDSPEHYSSALDLARLGLAALRDPVIRSVVQMRSAVIPWPQQHTTRVVGNIDTLLSTYPGATGIKTGYTSEAMNVVVGSATRGGESVVGVVMGEPAADLWPAAASVLDYGFALEAAGQGRGQGASGRADPVVIRAHTVPVPGVAPLPQRVVAPAPGPARVPTHPSPSPARAVSRRVWPAAAAVLAATALGLSRRRVRRRRRRRRAWGGRARDARSLSPGPRGAWP